MSEPHNQEHFETGLVNAEYTREEDDLAEAIRRSLLIAAPRSHGSLEYLFSPAEDTGEEEGLDEAIQGSLLMEAQRDQEALEEALFPTWNTTSLLGTPKWAGRGY